MSFPPAPAKPTRFHNTPSPLTEFLYGSPYYPEHWDAEIRAKDPALFLAAHWNVIRMAEFAWDLMEPEEGRFDFSLFDETIQNFGAVGIRTILCTPTAAPPCWLTKRFPEVLRMDDSGRPLCHGSRQHVDHFSEVFRDFSRKITQAMADHFADNPYVIGWQTDNEFHCHFSEDHSPAAQTAFVKFLRARHGSIAALNAAWGTAFWAQTYDAFEDIPTPRPGRPTHLNPAHVLDYHRFLAAGVAAFQREQIRILRAANSRWWITHNGTFHHVDYAGEFGADLDFLGYDSYPFFDQDPASRVYSQAFNMDYARAFCGNLLILEQQSGPGGQGEYLHDNPEPGEMRKLAWVNIARGADGILFFRERSCRFGAEEYWCGILEHDNVPRRRYREAAQLGEELERIGTKLLGTSVQIDIGIAGADFASKEGHGPITFGLPDPRRVAETVHTRLNQLGYAVGCVHPATPLEGLKVYIVPHFSVFDPDWVPAWEAWVRKGGVLVIGARTASKDLNGNVIGEILPGALRDLTGVRVEEYGRQNRPDLRPLPLRFGSDESIATDLWYEQLLPDADTKVLATWAGRHLAGSPAVTLRKHGQGAVLYVGTYFTADLIDALLPRLVEQSGVTPHPHTTPGVEQVVRAVKGKRFRFFINHNETAVDIPVTVPVHELITDQALTDRLHLEPTAVALFQESGS